MISYSPEFAEKIGSAVATILLSVVVRRCNAEQKEEIESDDMQFEIGFSDVEFYSALKTLREVGYMQSKNKRNGLRVFIPHPALLGSEDNVS